MAIDLTNPHDKFFKEVFSREDAARDFFATQLPEEVAHALDLRSFDLLKDSFVDETLREHFSDLLYKIALKDGGDVFIYLLMEHKSSEERFTLFQILRYMVKIWDARRESDGLLPILPVIYYHGKRRWSLSSNFHSLFVLPEFMRRHVPEFEAVVCDISHRDDETLKVGVMAGVAMLTMKYIFSSELSAKLPSIFRLFGDLATKRSGLEFLHTLLLYLGSATEQVHEEELKEIVEAAFHGTGGEIMNTIAEKYMQQGIQQGMQQGRQDEARGTLLRILNRRFRAIPKGIETRIRAATIEQLEIWIDLAIDAPSLDAIFLD